MAVYNGKWKRHLEICYSWKRGNGSKITVSCDNGRCTQLPKKKIVKPLINPSHPAHGHKRRMKCRPASETPFYKVKAGNLVKKENGQKIYTRNWRSFPSKKLEIRFLREVSPVF